MSNPVITVTGNLVADPELKFFASGDAYCNITVAVGSRKKDDNGNWVDGDTSYFDATVIGTLAENLVNSLTKGTRVVLSGTQSQRHWEDKEGNKRSSYGIKVDTIGPDLRWATAQVTKVAKTDGGSAPSPRTAPAQNSFDEEPF
jgi:single-strand DNA-binding protein